MVKSLSARLNSHWGRKQAIKWGGGVCCMWIHMCILCCSLCAWACNNMDVLSPTFSISAFNEWELTTLNFGVGVVCDGMSPHLSSICTANKAGTPRLATGGVFQRIWMLGSLPGTTNECCLFWGGVGWDGGCHLLTCWLVQVSIVWEQISCCYTEALLVYILLTRLTSLLLLFMLIVHCCKTQRSKLVDRSWVTLCSELVVLIGWLSSIRVKHSDHRVRVCMLPPQRWCMSNLLRVIHGFYLPAEEHAFVHTTNGGYAYVDMFHTCFNFIFIIWLKNINKAKKRIVCAPGASWSSAARIGPWMGGKKVYTNSKPKKFPVYTSYTYTDDTLAVQTTHSKFLDSTLSSAQSCVSWQRTDFSWCGNMNWPLG